MVMKNVVRALQVLFRTTILESLKQIKKVNIDIGFSSTFLTLNEKSEIHNEKVDHVTNIGLKSLGLRNLNIVVVSYLNINLIRN